MHEISEDTIDFAGITGRFYLPLRPLPPMYGNDVLSSDPYEDVFGNELPQFGHTLNIIPSEKYRTPDTDSEACVQLGSLRELIVTDKRTWFEDALEGPATQDAAVSNPVILHHSLSPVSAVAETGVAKTPFRPWQTIRSIGRKATNTIVATIDTVRGVSEKLSERPKLQIIGNLGAFSAAGAGVVLACAGTSKLTTAVRGTTSPDYYTDGHGHSSPLSPAIEDAHHHILDSRMPDVGNFFQTTFFEPNWRLLVWYTLATGITAAIPTAIAAIYMHNKHQN